MRWCADTESTSRHKTTSHNGEMLIDRLDSAQPPAFCFLCLMCSPAVAPVGDPEAFLMPCTIPFCDRRKLPLT